jgi:hypothetical protein
MKNYKRPKSKGDHKYTIYQDGNITMYYRYGCLHREKGAAYIDHTVNRKIYYRYGKIHRNDGPADIIENEFSDFYLNGERYNFDEWVNKTNASDEVKAHLILLYG